MPPKKRARLNVYYTKGWGSKTHVGVSIDTSESSKIVKNLQNVTLNIPNHAASASAPKHPSNCKHFKETYENEAPEV
jgi:hypothetical protein